MTIALGVPGVDEQEGEVAFKDVSDGLPAGAGALHGDLGHAAAGEPVAEDERLVGHRGERAHLTGGGRLSGPGSGIVRLQIFPGEGGAPGRPVISARADELGDNYGEVDCVVEGEAMKVAFNGKYLQDVLGVLDGGQVALESTTSSSPGVLRPVGGTDYVHVVMPMFVQW